VAELLDEAVGSGVLALHSRALPGHRSGVEHLAIGASGIHLVDVKHFRNATLEVRGEGATADLVMGSRVMTAAVVAMARRVEAVRQVLAEAGLDDVPVGGVVCFVDGVFPQAAPDLEVRGVHVLHQSSLTALVAASGEFGDRDREALRDFLAERFPPAA
jgi:hypothetical protein